ncbi:patatin-like phospholipase family protein [bacterium]|nr:patatin-like phospholipase family protein [bacterium]
MYERKRKKRHFDWFSLADQPQDPVESGGSTLAGAALDAWRAQFDPFLKYIRNRDVVLALSGGGMLLPCHISAIRVLELLGVNIRKIYGTSAGAVIGGLYAAGLTSAELQQMVLDIESPDELFGLAARFPQLRFVTNVVRRTLLGASPEESGIYDLTQVERFVSRVLVKYTGRVPKMSELGLDFSSIAFDMGTGEEASGSVSKAVLSSRTTPDLKLSDAISASMAIPGVFPPKRIAGRYFVDGSVVEQLPIMTAAEKWQTGKRRFRRRKLVIVAVDLGAAGSPPSRDKLRHPVDLVIHTHEIHGRIITQHSLVRAHRPRRGTSVVLIRTPPLDNELFQIEKLTHAL